MKLMFLDISYLNYYQSTCLVFLISFVSFLFCAELSTVKLLDCFVGMG